MDIVIVLMVLTMIVVVAVEFFWLNRRYNRWCLSPFKRERDGK
jgi:hypothetical protein